MTDFKCKNCESIFTKFCDTIDDSINVSCPFCGSHWIEIYYTPIEADIGYVLQDSPIYIDNLSPIKFNFGMSPKKLRW